MESLLFHTKEIWYGGERQVVKFPVWTGSFLRKIDLSTVSFDNVLWNEESFRELCGELGCTTGTIVLSHTNAKIDFKKSFWLKRVGKDYSDSFVSLSHADFSYMDLSKSNLSAIPGAIKTDFSHSIGDFAPIFLIHKKFLNCNFEDINLGRFEEQERSVSEIYSDFIDCNFSNTRLGLTYSQNEDGLELGKRLGQNIRSCKLVRCQINGISVKSREDLLKIK